MICASRKGFLTLSDCGDPAATMCANCGRPMCAKHLSPASGFSKCYDCAATDPQQQQQEGEEHYDDQWAHNYRDEYYRTSGYAPTYSTYDSHDHASFDSRQDDFGPDEFGDDVDRGGFGAS